MRALPVFFTPAMVADSQSFSPSAAKPLAVLRSWQRLGVPLAIHAPAGATESVLALAHDPSYVRAVLELRRANGFGNHSPAVAASLPYTTGAMLAGALHALAHGGVAIAPCSGFHHARWASGGGFCTFNGLMVTAAALHAEGAARVGILDCDMHYGDGTEDIIAHLGRPRWVTHFTAGAHYREAWQAERFLRDALPAAVREMQGCDVVLYQAGADPHIDDPLGGWLSTEELHERDRIVFELLHAMKVPVVWNLAGGYQQDANGGISKVLEIHDSTLRACARVHLLAGH